MTLEQLAVVSAPQITFDTNRVIVEFTPTVPHCGMSTFIGWYMSHERKTSLKNFDRSLDTSTTHAKSTAKI